MPRGRDDLTSGAAGRAALATFRDEDFEDFIAIVRWLPDLARTSGRRTAVAFWRTEGQSLVSLFRLAKADGADDLFFREATSSFFSVGVANVLVDPDEAGFNCQTAVIECVERYLFESSVRAVFERSAATSEKGYVPNVPP